MEVLYNGAGKAFVPASDFYKEYIYDQMNIAHSLGEEEFKKTQSAILNRFIFDSRYFRLTEEDERFDMLYVLNTDYETMDRWLNDPRGKTTVPEVPKIKLVK